MHLVHHGALLFSHIHCAIMFWYTFKKKIIKSHLIYIIKHSASIYFNSRKENIIQFPTITNGGEKSNAQNCNLDTGVKGLCELMDTALMMGFSNSWKESRKINIAYTWFMICYANCDVLNENENNSECWYIQYT